MRIRESIRMHNTNKDRIYFIAIILTTAICIGFTAYSLSIGQFTIFQNIFYIPIIIACFNYQKKGFIFSLLLTVIYFTLFASHTNDPALIGGALVRVVLFILIAGMITYLAIRQKETEKAFRQFHDELVTAEETLRDNETLKSHIIEAIPDLLFRINREGVFIDILTPDEDRLFVPKADAIGRRIGDIIPDELGEQMIGMIRQALEHQEIVTIEYSLTINAVMHHYEARIVPYLQDEVLVLARDVTERKASEDSLNLVNKKLQLLSSITRHDILNQIMALIGFLEFSREMSVDPTQARYLDEVKKAAEFIEDKIEFTRTYEQLGVNKPAWLRISDLIKEIPNPKLPIQNTCGDYQIFADPMILKVFSNLMDNTIRHGEVATEVHIQCTIQNNILVICWEDNGQGIPYDLKKRIFNRGFGKNTGFGLFLSREILSITEIAITETGVYGESAKFELKIPENAWRPSEEELEDG